MREMILAGSPALQFFVYWIFYIGIPLFHLVAAEVLFIADFQRTKHFILRAAAAFATMMVCSFLLLFVILRWGEQIVTFSIVYFSLYLLTGICIRMCCEENLLKIFFCCAGAQCIQNMTSRLARILFLLWKANNLEQLVIQNLLSVVLMTIVYLIINFTIIKRTRKNMYLKLNSRGIVSFVALSLLLTTVLSSACDLYVTETIPGFLCNMLFIFGCISAFFIQVGMFDRGRLLEEKELLKAFYKKEKQQMEFSRNNIDVINRKCHDARHMIHLMREEKAGVTRQFWEELESAVQIYDDSIATGNAAIDMVLQEKSLYCQKNKINLTCMLDGHKLSYLEDTDVYSLFGNAVENAMEAVICLPEEERNISITQQSMGDKLLLLQFVNPYAGEIRLEDGMPMTGKENTEYHGFGVRSIRAVAEKYKGEAYFLIEEGIFTLQIILPIQKKV